VFPTKFFLSTEDAHRLKKATNGSGTDKETIIQVLTNRSNSQRLEIKSQFEKLFTDDLLEQLKKHLSGDFRNLIEALLTPLPQLYAQELNRAVKGLGTDEKVLIEILCTLSNSEIRAAKHAYHKLYHKQLVDDIKDDTSGNFKSLLELLVSCTRDEYATVDVEEAQSDAQALYEAGEKRWGTDASFFNQILVRRSRGQLALIFEEYEKLTGHSMEKAIKGEFCGDIEDGLLAIVESVKNKAAFFAKRLYKSMKGMGTDDRTLIRIVVTRCEIDMAEIKWEYEANYSKTLANAIKVVGAEKNSFL
jgi:annexin A7/11